MCKGFRKVFKHNVRDQNTVAHFAWIKFQQQVKKPAKSRYIIYAKIKYRGTYRRFSVRKVSLGNIAKFTGKQVCQSIFFNKVAG